MAQYSPKTWVTGEPITAAELNAIEAAAAAAIPKADADAAYDAKGAATTAQAAAVQRANHTGTQSADTITDGATNKAYTAAEKTKLAGVAAGANVYTDAQAVTANTSALAAKATIADIGTAGTPTGDAGRAVFVSQPAGDTPATWVAGFHRGAVGFGSIEKLHIGVSSDGLNWRTYLPNFTPASGTVRDPQLFQSNGRWYVAYTSIAFGNGNTFGLAVSDDLVTWTNVTAPAIAGATQVWAPAPMFDTDGLHMIVSGDNKLYEIHPTTADLTAWSAAVQLTGTGLPTGMIDGQVTKVGSTYHLFAKDNSAGNAQSYIIHGTATALTGPYTAVGVNDWAGWGNTLEAPCLVDLGAGINPRYRLYFDHYLKGLTFYAESNDLTTFSAKKLSTTDLPQPRHMTPRLVGANAALFGAQQRIDRNPSPRADARKMGIFQVPEGWSQGTNAPGSGQVAARLTRVVVPRDMRVAGINFYVTAAAASNDAVDVGLYDADFQRVASSGAKTGLLNAGTGIKSASFTAPVQLKKGEVYFVGLSFSASVGTPVTVRSLSAPFDQDLNMLGGGAASMIDGYFQAVHPFPATLFPQQYNSGALQTSYVTFATALTEG